MADIFWTPATPVVATNEVPLASIPVRVAGAAASGAQDVFKQVALAELASVLAGTVVGAGGQFVA